MTDGSRKIFGLGLSKTGTSSLTDALNLLGVKAVHYPHDQRTYEELRAGSIPPLDPRRVSGRG